MNRSFIAMLVITAIATPARGAGWGPNGHPEVTYDAATSPAVGIPADVARVMALGSIVPDYFEFTTPAAHAQVPDPPLSADGRKITLDAEGFHRVSQQAFRESEKWHDFYFNAAVAEMKQGHRERAAFLLGYALHNREDMATHRGWTNLAHAAMDGLKKSPDADPKKLAAAHAMAALEMERFREQVGADNWRLFKGESIRRGIGSIVPEPLGVLAPGLEGWNPRDGNIPSGLGNRVADSAVDIVKKRLMALGYKPDLKGEMPNENLAKMLNFAAGLLPRQEQMAQLLDVARSAGDPRRPTTKNEVEIAMMADEAVEFAIGLPKRFAGLDQETIRTLLDRRNQDLWTQGLAQRMQELKERRQAMGREILSMQRAELERLKTRQGYAQAARAATAEMRRLAERDIESWNATHPSIAAMRPPTIDGTPAVREAIASTPSYSTSTHTGSRREEYDSPRQTREREREPVRMRESPTFNQLRSGNYRW